jgi:hypothetical protein
MKKTPIAPWPSVVLDSEGLWAVARNDSTSDPADIRALADCVSDRRIRPVRVSG